LIDDSIVRGNTIGPIIKLLSDAGAKEVHIRIASPPLKYPCYMGINIPTTEELIASRMDNLQLAQHVGKDPGFRNRMSIVGFQGISLLFRTTNIYFSIGFTLARESP